MTIMTTITIMTTHTTQPQGLALWLLITLDESVVAPVGPSNDTHGALGPLRRKAVGGPIDAPQGEVTHNDGALRRDKRHVSRQTWQARSETHTMSTLSTSRSGDAADHQEDRAEKRNQAPRTRSTRRQGTSRFTRISTLTKLLM